MNPIATQQAALDNALVPSEKRLKIERYFMELPSEKDVLTLIMELGYSGKSDMLSTIQSDQMHQPCRTFVAKNVDYVALLWEDFMYQADNREISSARKEYTPYLRFTKVIIDHFISKDNTISMRNRINLHTVHVDTLLGTLKFASKIEYCQIYGTASGSSKGVDFESDVLDEHADKTKDTSEGTGVKPGVPDVSKEDSSDSDDDSWGDNKNESDDVNEEDDDKDYDGDDDNSDDNDDGRNDDGGNEDDYEENPPFTLADYVEEEQDEEHVYTQEKDKSNNEEKIDTDMTNAEQGGEDQQNASHKSGFVKEEEDAHVTLTTVHDKTEGPLQSSSISSDLTSKLLNLDDQSPHINSLINTSIVCPPPPPVYPSYHPIKIPQQQTPDSTTTITNPTMTLPNIPNFASLFQFDQRVSALKTKVSEFKQTSQFAKVVSLIMGIVDNYLASKLKEEVNVAIQLQSNKLKEEAEAENQEFINKVDSTMKKIIKEQVKDQVSKIMPHIEDYVTESLRAEVLFNQRVSTLEAKVSEFNQTSQFTEDVSSILGIVDNYLASKHKEEVNVAVRLQLNKLKEEVEAENQEFFDRLDSTIKAIIKEQVKAQVSKIIPQIEKYVTESLRAKVLAEELEFEAADTAMQQDQGNESGHIDDQPDNEAAPKHDCQPSHTFDDLMDTPIDFSACVMNPLMIDNLTQEILVWPTFDLLKGTCKSFTKLKYHFEEYYKAVNDQLDWHNPKGREYSFDPSKPLPLIKIQGRQVVPTNYFINNDLKYLKGGSSSSKYVTSTTRTKAAKYDNIKGIEDMVLTL
nr:hypothetical protein [Tanacetum cinerariifolium]